MSGSNPNSPSTYYRSSSRCYATLSHTLRILNTLQKYNTLYNAFHLLMILAD
ncbi:hypothetical protein F441_02296, partial [Phytophthora nicotianae CJ01A1]